jgi:uncharacterized protein
MKIIFDTNVIISAFITHGLSSRVLDICIDNHQLFISQWIIDEVIEKLKNKIKVPDTEIRRINFFLSSNFQIIKTNGDIPDICRDNDDNNVLLLIQNIPAEMLITGDKDLLVLKNYLSARIISPREFLEKYNI